jgi:hypothetical protein
MAFKSFMDSGGIKSMEKGLVLFQAPALVSGAQVG